MTHNALLGALALVAAPAVAIAAAPTVAIVQPAPGGTPWSAGAIAKLDADLDAMLDASPALRGAHYGVFAVDTASGNVLYDRGGTGEFQPASTFKLVVGSAALDTLKPAFAFRTTLGFAGTGTAAATALVLTMGGDPTFTSADLAQGVATLPSAGFGDAFVDDSAFDRAVYPTGWTWDDFGEDYAAIPSAATLDENVVSLHVAPGSSAGEPARVSVDRGPAVLSTAEGCHAATDGRVTVVESAKTGPIGTDDTIDASMTRAGCPEIVGSIPLGAPPEAIDASVSSPLVAVHAALASALLPGHAVATSSSVAGRAIEPQVRAPGTLARQTPFWVHDSKPLSQMLGPDFWIPSDNLFGELLLKELGLAASGKPGSTAKGIAFEKTWLQAIGIDSATLTLADGCGMSQYDRITPRDLVTILQHDWNGPNRQIVLDSLPVGGARGSIEGIAGTAAAGRVFAKTGSMMHVRGLAGYLATQQHGAVTFAFEVDDWNGDYPSLAALRAQALARIVSDSAP